MRIVLSGSVVTISGFSAILNRAFITGSVITVPLRFKIGTGVTAPATTDTNLTTPLTTWYLGTAFKPYNSTTTFDAANQKVTTQAFVSSTEANGNVITEYGDFNSDAVSTCFSHTLFNSVTKTSGVQIYLTMTFRRA